jgi:hypothetical protein
LLSTEPEGGVVGVFDSTAEEPHSKVRRYIITGVAFAALVSLGVWYYVLRFHAEKKTVHEFMNALVAGQAEQAYRIWKPAQSYSYKDFLEDWGPDGYYGPVKSFHIEAAQHPRGGTGVVVVVELSPYQPFPGDNEAAKQSKTKEVHLWVEYKDQSLSFPP